LSVDPSFSPRVVPVVDYEPPPQGIRADSPPPGPLHPRNAGSPHPPQAVPAPTTTAHIRQAGAFADATLRRVLEVIDRRRPLAALRPLLAAGLVDSLLAAASRHSGEGAARLRRVRVQPAASVGTAAEVSASYTRGSRTHAIACRVEQVRTPTGMRWQVVALHIG